MSINMTQAFEFETDELKSFESMLATIIPIMFGHNSKYVKLHISGKPGHWNDGKSYDAIWEDVPKVMPKADGSGYELVETNQTYGGASVMGRKGIETKTLDEAAAEAMKFRKDASPPTRVWIATLSDYSGDYDKKHGDTFCRGHKHMLELAMECVKSADPDRLFEQCGDGFHFAFNRYDGDVGVGYRMHWEPYGGWNKLVLSFIHAYYGK